MKKVWAILVAALLALGVSGCSPEATTGGDTPSGDHTQKTTTGSVATTTATPATETENVMQGEGDLGKYHIKIVSAEKGKDYSDKAVLVVTYEWTNNGDKETSFSLAFDAKAYQGGVECSSLTVVDGVDAQKLLSNIKPGASLVVQEAYVLNDDSDVEVEVSELISFSDKKVVKTFSVK